MKKILSAALALVCIWFATPALAACNLFDSSVFNTDVGDEVTFKQYQLPNGTYTMSTNFPPQTGGRYTNVWIIAGKQTTGQSSDINGVSSDYPRTITVTDGWYTIFYRSTTASIPRNPKDYNWQLERGSTATPYQPYNPLCATCDGTVVNYVSATGTVSQSGTPTPTNPIEPTFYTQGDMVLRKVGTYADSYDATTGKITRRVGVLTLTGTEDIGMFDGNTYPTTYTVPAPNKLEGDAGLPISNSFAKVDAKGIMNIPANKIGASATVGNNIVWINMPSKTSVENFKSWLREQYQSGKPVTVYYPLKTATTEDWTETSYCETPIKIATTKYNETAFSPLNTALANAISVVDTVVSNTITQAASIATLQAQKQTRPNDIADDNEKCPAGKKCLLVEDASGVPHWYEIVTGRLPDGYTELEYIESTGTQYIDTNVLVTDDISWEGRFLSKNDTSKAASIFGYRWTETPTAQGNMRFVFIYPDGTFAVRFGVDASRTNLVMSGAETVTLKCEKDKFYANGSLFYTETQKNNEGEPQSGYLFNVNALNTVDISPVKMKLYYFKMWDGGTLVRDFVPALNPDGKIGMYDLANGVFYENKGTGTFIGGQPVFN